MQSPPDHLGAVGTPPSSRKADGNVGQPGRVGALELLNLPRQTIKPPPADHRRPQSHERLVHVGPPAHRAKPDRCASRGPSSRRHGPPPGAPNVHPRGFDPYRLLFPFQIAISITPPSQPTAAPAAHPPG